MRYRIDMSYCGAGFCGWQIQPGARTVQGELERALSTLLRASVQVVGAGRTDTGVNASHYVAHFDIATRIPQAFAINCQDGTGRGSSGNGQIGEEGGTCGNDQIGGDCGTARSGEVSGQVLDTAQLRYKLNAFLPDGIAIQAITPAAPDFHARFGARLREYTYYLNRTKSPFTCSWSYYYAYPVLDFDAMNAAARHLLGTHDFSCFEKSGGDNKTSVCTIYEAGWHPLASPGTVPGTSCCSGLQSAEEVPEGGSVPPSGRFPDGGYVPPSGRFADGGSVPPSGRFPDGGSVPHSVQSAGQSGCSGSNQSGGLFYFRIASDRFLRNMVRAIVGTLLEVGRGKRTVEEFRDLIGSGTRCDAGESVPGHALFLSRIEY